MSVGNPVNLAYSTQEQRIAKEPTLITLAQANHINPETKNAPLVKLVKRIIPNH
ncbi:hypothetical protein [Oceanobacillus iheyensis]|uniref:hypothetical protein n=1 Tax=Oceanobacillus iheyensis TaxID=182710 RepID=UPI0002F053B0|nr:hypothetical protein [Oceanobacillus iheyensis]